MPSASSLPRPATPHAPTPLFARHEYPCIPFPIQYVVIDWDRLVAKRPLVFATIQAMPSYLPKSEILALLAAETDPRYRLILDLMWTTGARVSEVPALTPSSFIDDCYDCGVLFKSLKQNSGRTSKWALDQLPKRFVPIADMRLKKRVQSYLWASQFKRDEKLFPPMCAKP